MKTFALLLVFLSSAVAYAGDAYVKTFHKGKNWTVLQVGMTGQFKQCAIRSSPSYLDSGKNPKYGTIYLDISYPTNNVTLSGENIGVYFRIAKGATLQVGEGKSFVITPETPATDKSIVDDMLTSKANVIRVSIAFGNGDPSIHTFPSKGLPEAYKMLPACASISSVKTKDAPSPQGSRVALSLDSFLTSVLAKQYGITKQGGWALKKDGLYNNALSVSGLRESILEATTKGSDVIDMGLMFLGTTSLDSSQMLFVLELLKAIDPSTAQMQRIGDGISKSLSKRVSQIDLAPARTYGKLQVRAANVGGDAVISIKL